MFSKHIFNSYQCEQRYNKILEFFKVFKVLLKSTTENALSFFEVKNVLPKFLKALPVVYFLN